MRLPEMRLVGFVGFLPQQFLQALLLILGGRYLIVRHLRLLSSSTMQQTDQWLPAKYFFDAF